MGNRNIQKLQQHLINHQSKNATAMTKRLSKQELKFAKNIKNQIDRDSQEKPPTFWNQPNPIFIPKRKKKK